MDEELDEEIPLTEAEIAELERRVRKSRRLPPNVKVSIIDSTMAVIEGEGYGMRRVMMDRFPK